MLQSDINIKKAFQKVVQSSNGESHENTTSVYKTANQTILDALNKVTGVSQEPKQEPENKEEVQAEESE